jgi:hypothetical protein
MKIPNSCKK